MTPILEVGDIIVNDEGDNVEVTEILKARHGLLVTGKFASGTFYRGFFPWELAGEEELEIYNWYGWNAKNYATLPNGWKVGVVSIHRSDPRPRTPEEYDKAWEETIRLIREEEYGQTNHETPNDPLSPTV